MRGVVIDTDIGFDVDDAYALAFAARSPMVIEGVTTVYGDTLLRAKIARKVLRLAGREDIPVIAGLKEPISKGRRALMFGFEGEGILDEENDLELPVPSDAVKFIVSKCLEGKTLITIGPLTNAAVALRSQPELAEKVEEIIVMGGILEPIVVEGKELPLRTEYNVNCDPEATMVVLESGKVTLVPLNITMRLENALGEADLARLRDAGTPLTRTLLKASELWLRRLSALSQMMGMPPERVRLWMHDPLTVAVAVRRDLFKIEKANIKVCMEKGELRITFSEEGYEVNICKDAKYKAFKEMLINRLTEK